jgi:hypothetical protein
MLPQPYSLYQRPKPALKGTPRIKLFLPRDTYGAFVSWNTVVDIKAVNVSGFRANNHLLLIFDVEIF